MRRVLFLLFVLGPSLGICQSVQAFHVTKVIAYPKDEGEPIPAGDSIAVPRWKVWGYTDNKEYILACTEVQKDGTVKMPCAPMSAGQNYSVKVFEPNAIGFPAEQPNRPEYGWYMIRQEEERKHK
jgi:hypothetical protein